MVEKIHKCPPCKLLLLGIGTTVLSLFSYGFQFAVTGLTSDVLRRFINESQSSTTNSGSKNGTKECHKTYFTVEVAWSMITSILPLSSAVGCFIAPSLADKFGRRSVLFFIGNIVVVLGSMLVLMSKYFNLWQILLFARFVFGVQCGLVLTILPVYLTECSPIQYRGLMGAFHGPVAYLSSFVAQLFSLSHLLGTIEGWYWLYSLGAFPALVQMGLYFVAPESPEYEYLKKKDKNSALKTIATYFGPDYSDEQSQSLSELLDTYNVDSSDKSISLIKLFTTKNICPILILAVALGAARAATGDYVLGIHTKEALVGTKLQEEYIQWIGIGLQAIGGIFASIGCCLVERVGRRKLLISTLSIVWACWVVNVTLDFIYEFHHSSITIWLSVSMLMTIYAAYPVGCSTVTWFMASELSSQSARATLSSLSLISGTSAVAISSFAYPIMTKWDVGGTHLLLFALPLPVFIGLFWFRLPETLNRTIPEIVSEIESRAGKKRDEKLKE